MVSFTDFCCDDPENGKRSYDQKLKPKYEELYESSAYMIVDEFLNEIEQVKGYKISKEERLFLSISVAGMRTPANTAEIEQRSVFRKVLQILSLKF